MVSIFASIPIPSTQDVVFGFRIIENPRPKAPWFSNSTVELVDPLCGACSVVWQASMVMSKYSTGIDIPLACTKKAASIEQVHARYFVTVEVIRARFLVRCCLALPDFVDGVDLLFLWNRWLEERKGDIFLERYGLPVETIEMLSIIEFIKIAIEEKNTHATVIG